MQRMSKDATKRVHRFKDHEERVNEGMRKLELWSGSGQRKKLRRGNSTKAKLRKARPKTSSESESDDSDGHLEAEQKAITEDEIRFDSENELLVFRVNRDNPRDCCDSWHDPDLSAGVHAGLQQQATDEDEWQNRRFALELDRTNEEALNILIQQAEIALSTCPRCTSVDGRCGGLCVADAHEASAAGSNARATDEAVI